MTPTLLYRAPDWLGEDRGRNVPEGQRWYPIVTGRADDDRRGQRDAQQPRASSAAPDTTTAPTPPASWPRATGSPTPRSSSRTVEALLRQLEKERADRIAPPVDPPRSTPAPAQRTEHHLHAPHLPKLRGHRTKGANWVGDVAELTGRRRSAPAPAEAQATRSVGVARRGGTSPAVGPASTPAVVAAHVVAAGRPARHTTVVPPPIWWAVPPICSTRSPLMTWRSWIASAAAMRSRSLVSRCRIDSTNVDQVVEVVLAQAVADQHLVDRGVGHQVLELRPTAVRVDHHRTVERRDPPDDAGEGQRVARTQVGVEHLEQRCLLGVQPERVDHQTTQLGRGEPLIDHLFDQPASQQRADRSLGEVGVPAGESGHDGECSGTSRFSEAAQLFAGRSTTHLVQTNGPQKESVRLLIQKIHGPHARGRG